MRRKIILPLLAAAGALAVAGPALAQGYRQNYGYAAPNDPMASGGGRGNYGGGFIEMLMTGRDPTPAGRGGAVYNRPGGYAYGQRVQPQGGYEDPFEAARQPRAGRRMAALGEPVEP